MFNPRLSDLFFWHFHPEYELVYIDNATGTRHVGDHIASYEGSELVLIGSYIPHLNFDYGVKSEYRKVVLHLKKAFVEEHLCTIPELGKLAQLFEDSRYGLTFPGEAKHAIGEKLFQLEEKGAYEQYTCVLDVLQELAHNDTAKRLHEKPYSRRYSDREEGRLRDIYAYVDKHYPQKIELQEVAHRSHMSKEAFCRYFKRVTSYTFIDFLNRYRVSQAKRLLLSGKHVSTVCYECGFESLSYFNRVFKKVTGDNPSAFRKKHL